jgi:hypothetical protein
MKKQGEIGVEILQEDVEVMAELVVGGRGG